MTHVIAPTSSFYYIYIYIYIYIYKSNDNKWKKKVIRRTWEKNPFFKNKKNDSI